MKKFLVLTGPSAVGKSTVIKYLLNDSRFHLSISYTTRRPRPWEFNNVDYVFVSKEEFEMNLSEGFFLEHTCFSGNYYGTPDHIDKSDKVIVFDVDIRGYHFFKQQFPESFFCLVTADSNMIELRLKNRVRIQADEDATKDVKTRMSSIADFQEVTNLDSFNVIINNSGTVNESYLQVDTLIDKVVEHFNLDV